MGDQQSVEMFRSPSTRRNTRAQLTLDRGDDDPVEGILSTARDNARIIVLGSRRSRLDYHGGVVERVISGADCPVVVVRLRASPEGASRPTGRTGGPDAFTCCARPAVAEQDYPARRPSA